MEALPWLWIWIIIAAILAILEMLSLSFFLLPFAVGALLAAVMSALGLELLWQVVVFVVASAIALVAMRPLARRLTRKGSTEKAGAERLVGMQGKVVEGESRTGEFRVVVGGEPWNAVTMESERLEPDTAIEVLQVKGNALIVRELY